MKLKIKVSKVTGDKTNVVPVEIISGKVIKKKAFKYNRKTKSYTSNI